MKRTRSWTWTLNNPTEEEELKIQQMQCQYLIYGKEIGEKGTPHLQGYTYFKNKKSLKQLKKLIPRVHAEASKGSAAQNIDYCSKDGEVFEKGTPPKGSGAVVDRAQRNRTLLETPMEVLVSEGTISVLTVPALMKARYLMSLNTNPLTRVGTCGFWVYGPPGVGKTHYVSHLFEDAYKKSQNKWWDGYTTQENVILDDLDTPTLGHYLKIWMDKWPCYGEIKGGTVALRHKRFVVTSNYTPEQLWTEDPVLAAAVSRRCTFKEMNKTI